MTWGVRDGNPLCNFLVERWPAAGYPARER
jgi:hypothetical protein